MATAQIKLKVRVSWWIRPYLRALAFFCRETGFKPDLERLQKIIERSIKVERV